MSHKSEKKRAIIFWDGIAYDVELWQDATWHYIIAKGNQLLMTPAEASSAREALVFAAERVVAEAEQIHET